MHHVMSADRQTKIVDWHNDTRMRLQEKSEILVATNTERGWMEYFFQEMQLCLIVLGCALLCYAVA